MKKLLILIFLTMLIASCSSDSGSDSAADGTVLLTKIIRESANGSTNISTYTYDGRKMITSALTYSSSKLYYSGNLITKIESRDNNDHLMSVFTFEYNASEKLMQHRLVSPDIEVDHRTTYVYNDDNTISVNFYRTFDGTETLQLQKYFLDAEGEIIKIEKYGTTGTEINLYTYDTKNNPFRNVAGFDKLLNLVSLGMKHNILSTHQTAIDGTITHYEKNITYNDSGYPLTMQQVGSSAVERYYY